MKEQIADLSLQVRIQDLCKRGGQKRFCRHRGTGVVAAAKNLDLKIGGRGAGGAAPPPLDPHQRIYILLKIRVELGGQFILFSAILTDLSIS